MIRFILLGLAVAAATAAFMLYRMGSTQPPVTETIVSAPQVAEVQVLVAERALPKNHRIEPGDIGWTDWPETRVQPFFTIAETSEQPVADFEGLYTNRTYAAGEPLDAAALDAVRVERLSDRVSPGLRAVAVVASVETTAGGFVKVDDYVDIIRVGPVGNGAAGSSVILENVRVLAVGESMGDVPGMNNVGGSDTMASNPSTVTVELTPQQARLLAAADYDGQLALTLRTRADRAPIGPDVPAPSTAVPPGHSIDVLQGETWEPHEVP